MRSQKTKYILPYIKIKNESHGYEFYNYLFSDKLDYLADHDVRKTLCAYTDDRGQLWEQVDGYNLKTASVDGISIANAASKEIFDNINAFVVKKHPDVELKEVNSYDEARAIFRQNAIAKLGIEQQQGRLGK